MLFFLQAEINDKSVITNQTKTINGFSVKHIDISKIT